MKNEREVKLFDDEGFDIFKPFNIFNLPIIRDEEKVEHAMRTDIKENDNDYTLEMEMPGYDKNNIDVQLKKGYLTVSAERHENKDEKDKKGNYIRRERIYGKASRSFYVGENVKEQDIDAKLEHGILTVVIAKKTPEVEQNKKILIK